LALILADSAGIIFSQTFTADSFIIFHPSAALFFVAPGVPLNESTNPRINESTVSPFGPYSAVKYLRARQMRSPHLRPHTTFARANA
jgi:hypothetical protein